MPKDFVSIVITHYHQDEERAGALRKSIGSLLANTVHPYELTVVDNGKNLEDSEWLLKLADAGRITTYIRNAENMHFGYARNQGFAMSDGRYICIADNDILYKGGWLTSCVQVLRHFPDEKIYATPVYNVTHHLDKYWGKSLTLEGKVYRLNSRAGSNCFVVRRKDYLEIGQFSKHRVAGTKWTEKAIGLGYMAAVTPELYIKDMGFRKGYNYKDAIPVKKVLSDGGKVFYNEDEFKRNNSGLHYIQQKTSVARYN